MPREWPPVSVWLLAPPLFGPPAILIGHAARRGWYDLVLAGCVLLGLATSVFVGVLVGRPVGLKTLGWLASCLGLVVGVAVVVQIVRGNLRAAAEGLPPACWVVAVMGLRLWPETRRWCGLLPPADEDAE